MKNAELDPEPTRFTFLKLTKTQGLLQTPGRCSEDHHPHHDQVPEPHGQEAEQDGQHRLVLQDGEARQPGQLTSRESGEERQDYGSLRWDQF